WRSSRRDRYVKRKSKECDKKPKGKGQARMTAKDDAGKPSSEQRLIRELADLLNDTGLSEIEIEKSGLKIRVARSVTVAAAVASPPPAPVAPPLPGPAPAAGAPAPAG